MPPEFRAARFRGQQFEGRQPKIGIAWPKCNKDMKCRFRSAVGRIDLRCEAQQPVPMFGDLVSCSSFDKRSQRPSRSSYQLVQVRRFRGSVERLVRNLPDLIIRCEPGDPCERLTSVPRIIDLPGTRKCLGRGCLSELYGLFAIRQIRALVGLMTTIGIITCVYLSGSFEYGLSSPNPPPHVPLISRTPILQLAS